jgi:hypothetical protein
LTKSSRSKDNHTFNKGVPLFEGPRKQVSGGVGFLKVHGSKFPAAWAEAARIVFAFMPTSEAAERVISMLKAMFGDQATTALADYIQTAITCSAATNAKSTEQSGPVTGPLCLRVKNVDSLKRRGSRVEMRPQRAYTRPHSCCTQSAAGRCGGWQLHPQRHAERRARLAPPHAQASWWGCPIVVCVLLLYSPRARVE